MRFLFVMDPIQSILPDKDTTFVLMLESQRRRHETWYCQLGDLFVRRHEPWVRTRRAEVCRATPHHALFEERTEKLAWFDAIFMRKDPPVDAAYWHATQMLSMTPPDRTLVVNAPHTLRDANEKLYALNFPDVIPDTIVTSDMQRLKQFAAECGGGMILKPVDGAGGAGIFHARLDDRNLNALLEAATNDGRQLAIGQQYIPEVRQGDKRIILLDGEPLGAVLRVPRDDEHRGNIHVGGNVAQTGLTESDQRIVRAIAPRLRADGLLFVGIDVIGSYLTEINVTSPTGIQEINRLDAVVLEDQVIGHIETRVAALDRSAT
jgi:glutathione synthase